MIVPMKKVHIVALKEDQKALLMSIQKSGELMLVSSTDVILDEDAYLEENIIQRTEKSMRFLKKFQEKQKLFSNYHEVDYDTFISTDPKREQLLEQVEQAEEQLQLLKNENDSLKETILFLKVWSNLDLPLNKLAFSKYVNIHLGFSEAKNIVALTNLIQDAGGEINLFETNSEGQALMIANYFEDDQAIMEKVRLLGFNEITLPNEPYLVSELIAQKQNKINENDQLIVSVTEEMQRLSKQMTELKLLSDQMATVSEIKKAPLQKTLSTIYLEGWVREDRQKALIKAIEEVTDVYDMAFFNPSPDETPPTVTKNNRFITAVETITDMFAKPNPNEVDPNPMMSFWYWIIFGIMMADVGYGIVMIGMFYALIKLMKPKGNSLKLFKVLIFCGITTIIWGVLFGSYFGATWNPILLEPMKKPLELLIMSLIIGALHVISGLLVKIYANIKNKQYFAAFADQVSWIFVIVGLGMLFLPKFAQIGQILALVGAGLILIFAGRKNKNLLGRLGSGLYSLYGATGYMSDILSYSRILALSLSTAVIGMVMNMLAGMVQGSIIGFVFSIGIYLVGHVFNLVMGLLSAYVHDSRLQYIEFFGKFYEGGGYEFKPLSLKLKHINQVNENKNSLGGI
ncbi:MAG: V-type ATP synthase subunit I [Bacilli bacterium]